MDRNDYVGAKITDIQARRREDGGTELYATLLDSKGRILITATIEYITKSLRDRLPCG